MNDALLRVEGLSTYYYTDKGVVRAVDGVDLVVGENEVVGVVGESGCGKSTLAASVMRLLQPPAKIVKGSIFFRNVNLLELPEEEMRKLRGKKISMIFQNPASYLNPLLTVEEQMVESMTLHLGISKQEAASRAVNILEKLGISAPDTVIKYYPHQLSGGMKQRVMIGMAISCNPELVLADEPTTALDPTIQVQILEQLLELRKNLGLSMVVITHDLGVAKAICDKIYVMYAGKIVEEGKVGDVFNRPLHPYTYGLLESALSVYEKDRPAKFIDGAPPKLVEEIKGCYFANRCFNKVDRCLVEYPHPSFKNGRKVYCWNPVGD